MPEASVLGRIRLGEQRKIFLHICPYYFPNAVFHRVRVDSNLQEAKIMPRRKTLMLKGTHHAIRRAKMDKNVVFSRDSA